MKKTYFAVPFAALLIALGACHQSSAEASSPTTSPTSPAPFTTPPVLAGTPDVATLAAKVNPAVVSIIASHELKSPRGAIMIDPFGEFFGGRRGREQGGDRVQKQQALGSGFIVDNAGHVVTNAHVVDDADTVKVRLEDERELEAKVLGRDERLDLAVLEIKGAKNLPQVSLGSSDALRVGEYVVAVGNPFGLGHTVTMGIVSAKSRAIGAGPYDDFIQTDASINPGNSGGPLFNLNGQVVGINTAINPNGRGIGFAIPVDALKDVLSQLVTTGHVARGRLGVVIQPVDEALAKALGLERSKGALVAEVEPGGPADKAGVKPGDLILGVDQSDVAHSQDLPRMVARHAPGTHVSVRVLRDKQTRAVDMTLAQLKDERVEEHASTAPPSGRAPEFGLDLDDANGGGALVRRVVSSGDENLVPGDVVLEVNRAPVRDANEAMSALRHADSGRPILLKVRREGRMLYVALSKA